MTKRLHVGDFSGFNILVIFVIYLFKKSTRRVRTLVIKYVLLYVVAIILQAAALMVFYVSVKLYVDPMSYDLSKVEKYFSLSILTNVELLLVTLTPAFLFLLVSSKLLKYCRVGLANLTLTLKEQLLNKYLKRELFFEDDSLEVFFKQLDGSFGAVRALFLNLFVFFQAFASAIALAIFEPILALVNILFLFFFLYILTTLKPTKEDKKDIGTEVVDIMDEELGLNSKSFERLERLRVLGRNYSNIGLFIFVLVGIILSLDFMNTIEQFTVTLILIRYSMQVYTPIAVISAASVPYKKNLCVVYNIVRLNEEFIKNKFEGDTKEKSLYVIVLKRATLKETVLTHKENNTLKNFFDKNNEYNFVHLITTQFEENSPIPKKQLLNLLKEKRIKDYDKLLFCA